MLEVRIRDGFSDRNGIKKENTDMQMTELDERSRVQLINAINSIYDDIFQENYFADDAVQDFLKFVIGSIYSEPIDARIEYNDRKVLMEIKDTILNDNYDSVLSLIEAVIKYWHNYLVKNDFEYHEDDYDNSLFRIINDILLVCRKKEDRRNEKKN